MKKLSLRNKILSVIALLLCVVIIGATVHLITTVTSANKSSAGEDLSDFDVVFSGKINLLEYLQMTKTSTAMQLLLYSHGLPEKEEMLPMAIMS